jgi:hypothetical protein
MKLTKGIITVIFLASLNCSAQIAVISRTGLSDNFKPFAGIEIQGSNVSVDFQFRPQWLDKKVYINGFGLTGTFYLYSYQSTPFVSTGIITHGKYNLSDITGKAKRSMIVSLGYRFYPSDKFKFIDDHLSFDIGIGIELTEESINPYFEFTMNIIIF